MALKCLAASSPCAGTSLLSQIKQLDSSSSSWTSPSSSSLSSLAFRVKRFPKLRSYRLPRLRATSEQQVEVFATPAENFGESRRNLDLRTEQSQVHNAQVSVESSIESGTGLWPPIQQDVSLTLLVLAGGWAWVRLFDFLTKQKFLNQKLSRKVVHITSGLLFVLCWPLYSAFPWAQYIAAVVPLCNGIRLLIYGLGLKVDEGLVKSVSREGDPKELLRGPLYYVVVLVFSTILFWRDSPVGVMALSMMCGGDGIADIVGRRFGDKKLPWNEGKSWAGSVAMFLFGLMVSYGCLCYFAWMGFYPLDARAVILKLAVASLAATVVESLPVSTKLDDNVTVPLTTVVVGMLLFPGGGKGMRIM